MEVKNDHQDIVTVDCSNCRGSGKVSGKMCQSCHGSGKAVRIIHKR